MRGRPQTRRSHCLAAFPRPPATRVGNYRQGSDSARQKILRSNQRFRAIGDAQYRGRVRSLYPGEFVRFLRIAAGSIQETVSHLTDAHHLGYISENEREQLKRLALRAFKANVRL